MYPKGHAMLHSLQSADCGNDFSNTRKYHECPIQIQACFATHAWRHGSFHAVSCPKSPGAHAARTFLSSLVRFLIAVFIPFILIQELHLFPYLASKSTAPITSISFSQ